MLLSVSSVTASLDMEKQVKGKRKMSERERKKLSYSGRDLYRKKRKFHHHYHYHVTCISHREQEWFKLNIIVIKADSLELLLVVERCITQIRGNLQVLDLQSVVRTQW